MCFASGNVATRIHGNNKKIDAGEICWNWIDFDISVKWKFE